MSGEPHNLAALLTALRAGLPGKSIDDVHWGVAGIGRYQLPIATLALTQGGHVRVGFEDNIFYKKGEVARSNAQLVERIARLAGELGREVATCAQAREMLELR